MEENTYRLKMYEGDIHCMYLFTVTLYVAVGRKNVSQIDDNVAPGVRLNVQVIFWAQLFKASLA